MNYCCQQVVTTQNTAPKGKGLPFSAGASVRSGNHVDAGETELSGSSCLLKVGGKLNAGRLCQAVSKALSPGFFTCGLPLLKMFMAS